MKMQAEERLEKTHLAASAPIAVSRVICQYSVISNDMIRKTKMSFKCGFQFTLTVRFLPGLPKVATHSELQRPGVILLTIGLLVFYHFATKIPS